MRTHVKMRYQETLARFSLTFPVEFCKLLSDLRDRKSHLLDGIKQREHREHREHTQSTARAGGVAKVLPNVTFMFFVGVKFK